MMNCLIWITLAQTQVLLNVKHVCTLSKPAKRWSKLSSKAKVQRWDTCPEPTEMRLIGWLAESIWTPKIQIKRVDTKNQVADMLTKGNFTRDEWNHLLRLFNNMSFSMFSCSLFSPSNNPQTMSKRLMLEEKTRRRRMCFCEIKTCEEFSVATVDSSPIALGSSASYSPETLKAQHSNSDLTGTGRPVARGSNENTASSSQVWHWDVNTNTNTELPMAEMLKKPIDTTLFRHNFEVSLSSVGWAWEIILECTKNFVADRETIYLTSTSSRWSGECLCQRPWELRYILDKINKRICVPPKIPTSKRSNSCSTFWQKLLLNHREEI